VQTMHCRALNTTMNDVSRRIENCTIPIAVGIAILGRVLFPDGGFQEPTNIVFILERSSRTVSLRFYRHCLATLSKSLSTYISGEKSLWLEVANCRVFGTTLCGDECHTGTCASTRMMNAVGSLYG
jgi:hypothetical protein